MPYTACTRKKPGRPSAAAAAAAPADPAAAAAAAGGGTAAAAAAAAAGSEQELAVDFDPDDPNAAFSPWHGSGVMQVGAPLLQGSEEAAEIEAMLREEVRESVCRAGCGMGRVQGFHLLRWCVLGAEVINRRVVRVGLYQQVCSTGTSTCRCDTPFLYSCGCNRLQHERDALCCALINRSCRI
jgi:hypothetical protein